MQPLNEFKEQVDKVVQLLDETGQIDENLVISLSNCLSANISLHSRELGELLLELSIRLWNRVVESYSVHQSTKNSKQGITSVFVKLMHVAADTICFALSSLSGISGTYNIDWFMVSNQFLSVALLYLELNLTELAEVSLQRCLEIISNNCRFLSTRQDGDRITHLKFSVYMGLLKVYYLTNQQISFLETLESIDQLKIEKEKVEYLVKFEYNVALSLLNKNHIDESISISERALESLSQLGLYETLNIITSKVMRLLSFSYLMKNEYDLMQKYNTYAESLLHSPISTYLSLRQYCSQNPKDYTSIDQMLRALLNDSLLTVELLDYSLSLLKDSPEHLQILLSAYNGFLVKIGEADQIGKLHIHLKIIEVQIYLERYSDCTDLFLVVAKMTKQMSLEADDEVEQRIGNLWIRFLRVVLHQLLTGPIRRNLKPKAEIFRHLVECLNIILSNESNVTLHNTLHQSVTQIYRSAILLSLFAIQECTEEQERNFLTRHTAQFSEMLLEREPQSVLGDFSYILSTDCSYKETSNYANSGLLKYAAVILKACGLYKERKTIDATSLLLDSLEDIVHRSYENDLTDLSENVQKVLTLLFLFTISFTMSHHADPSVQQDHTAMTSLSRLSGIVWDLCSNQLLTFKHLDEVEQKTIWDTCFEIVWDIAIYLHEQKRYSEAAKHFKCLRILCSNDEAISFKKLQLSFLELSCLLTVESDACLDEAACLLEEIYSQIRMMDCFDNTEENLRVYHKYNCTYLLCKACYLGRSRNIKELEQLIDSSTAIPFEEFQKMLSHVRALVR